MTTLSPRAGFTLVEVAVVAALGSVLALAVVQAMTTSSRSYEARVDRARAEEDTRSGIELLARELREVSPAQGDLVRLESDGVTFRSATGAGLVCDVELGSTPRLVVRGLNTDFAVSDTVSIFADDATGTAADDAWIDARVTAVDAVEACGQAAVQRLSFAGQAPGFAEARVRSGALVRVLRTRRYELGRWMDEPWLVRIDETGSVPVVGPLDATGPAFDYLDEDGLRTSTPSEVAQVVVDLARPGSATEAADEGSVVSRSIRIQPRN